MRKITQLFLVVLLMVLSLGDINKSPSIKAQTQTEIVIDIEVDEGSAFDVEFFELFPFNENGIAIFSILDENDESVKYGIINDQGVIVLEPIYSTIADFSSEWYITYLLSEIDGSFEYTYGLVSKIDGNIELKNEYNYLSKIFEYDLFTATKKLPAEGWSYNQERYTTEIKTSNEGRILNAQVPDEFVTDGLYQAYTTRLNNEYRIMHVDPLNSVYSPEGLEGEAFFNTYSWFTDVEGKIINNRYYDDLKEYSIINGTYYFLYDSAYDLNGTQYPGGILEVSLDNGLGVIELINEDNFDNFFQISTVRFFGFTNNIARIVIGEGDDRDERFFDVTKKEFLSEYSEPEEPGFTSFDEVRKWTLEINDRKFFDYDSIIYYPSLGWYSLHKEIEVNDYYNSEDKSLMSEIEIYDVDEDKIIHTLADFTGLELIRKGYSMVQVRANETDSLTLLGVMNNNGEYLLNPQYVRISEFSNQGYAKICVEDNWYRCGLVDSDWKIVLEPEYSVEQISYDSMWLNVYDSPLFDENNHLKIYNFQVDQSENRTYFYGLANKNGVRIEAGFEKAYFNKGYYYTLLDGVFEVFDEDEANKFRLETFNNEFSIDSYEYVSMEFVDNKYFVFGYSYVPEGFIDYDIEPEVFGVLDIDQNMFLEPIYTSIKYNNGLFYLEKRDQMTGELVTGVMNENKEMVVPFDNGYSSVSDFVGDFAIGQAGEKASESPQLFSFFKSVKANTSEFKLDVLNSQGEVVGDLSDNFEYATLLSTDEDDTLALIKRDGVMYLGKLVETERVVSDPNNGDSGDEYYPDLTLEFDADNFPGFNIEGFDDYDKLGILLTEEQIENNATVRLQLRVFDDTELNEVDKKLLDEYLKGETILKVSKMWFIDISMFIVAGESLSSVHTIDEPITISFEVPKEFRGSDFELLRFHGEEIESLEFILDSITNIITFTTDKFSTYALIEASEEQEETQSSNDDEENEEALPDDEENEEALPDDKDVEAVEEDKLPDTSNNSPRNLGWLAMLLGLVFVLLGETIKIKIKK